MRNTSTNQELLERASQPALSLAARHTQPPSTPLAASEQLREALGLRASMHHFRQRGRTSRSSSTGGRTVSGWRDAGCSSESALPTSPWAAGAPAEMCAPPPVVAQRQQNGDLWSGSPDEASTRHLAALDRGHRRTHGVVYTPSALAAFVLDEQD